MFCYLFLVVQKGLMISNLFLFVSYSTTPFVFVFGIAFKNILKKI